MFINSNYSSKLSPTMTENWLVQIYKNTNSSVAYTDTPDLRFSFSETVYDGENYYPAILNKPSISYSLDLKGFTTKTGSVTLNLANIDLDGTTLLELLGNEYINGQVSILSQIDNDGTAANALQIFSGRISSFGYRGNTIVLSVVSNRPFQNVSIPQGKTESTTDQYNNKVIPLVMGEYTPNKEFENGTDVYACPFLKNDGKNFIYIIPEGTDGSQTHDLEFYDKGMKRFIPLTDTNTSVVAVDEAKTLSVPKEMKRVFKVLPDDVTSTLSTGWTLSSGSLDNTYNGVTGDGGTFSSSSFSGVSRGVVLKLVVPQVTGKITAITLDISGTYSQTLSGSPAGVEGAFFNLANALSSGFGSTSGDVRLVGTESNGDKANRTNVALPTSTDISGILENGALPDELYLSFKFNAENDGSYDSANIILNNMYVTITAENDLANEPIASQEFNAGIEKVYLGRDITTESFTAYSSVATLTDLDNPVAIHRELLHSILNVANSDSDAKIENSGYKAVAELRDSTLTSPTSTHWKTRLALDEPEALEGIMNKLQYEGCFFFEFSPQSNQTAISGVSPLRYFTIADSVQQQLI